METSSPLPVFELLAITLITIVLVQIVSIIYHQCTYWKKCGVPYVQVMPLFGTVLGVILYHKSFPDYLKLLYNSYPNVKYIGTMDLTTATVIVRDPELIKEMGVKCFDHFPDHRGFVTEEMDPILGKNVFVLKGDRWRKMRNTLSPFFTASKMKFMFGLLSKCSYDFVDYLYNHLEVSSKMEAKDTFTRYTNDVIAAIAFGINVNSVKNRNNEFYTTGRDVANFNDAFRLFKLLLLRLSPRLMRMVGVTFVSRSSMKFFRNVISETMEARDVQGVVRHDMIHLLMQARNKEPLSTSQVTTDDIIAQAFIFFLAGFDTSSTLMCYMTYELALNQDIQEKLRDEVDHYLAEGNGEISYELLMKMEYMDMVISETLRKYPPVLIIDRLVAKKFQLPPAGSGYKSATIYPGENVWFPVLAIHHDPKYFPDPEKFDPERFNAENKNNIVPYTYIPFGLGPRMCIGNRFALMETKILMAHLLQKLVIKPNEKTKPLVYKKGSFQLVPIDGFWFSFEKRSV